MLTITGQHFGDDCLDTGTLPQGVGPLGDPLTGLVIVIDQGEHEFVVATGSAGSDYSFHVDVVVPAGLEPGAASLALLGAGDARLTDNLPLVISSAPAPRSDEATVATFGPPTPDTEPPGTVPPPVLPGDIPDPQVATVPPLSTTPVADRWRQRPITGGRSVWARPWSWRSGRQRSACGAGRRDAANPRRGRPCEPRRCPPARWRAPRG